jgi:hypothetical protein
MRQKIQPIFTNLGPTLGASTEITGINPLQRCRNLPEFQLARRTQILEHLLSLALVRDILPIRRGVSVQLIINAMQSGL